MIRRLTLTNFRNYRAAALATGDRPIVLFGPNGAGKTNLDRRASCRERV